MKDFTDLRTADFIDFIVDNGEDADEAMFYLLHNRMKLQMKKLYETYQHNLLDGFDDVIDDFFLYLRDGINCKNQKPYQSLRRIKNKDTFTIWILRTFRNYLNIRTAKEGCSFDSDVEYSPSQLTDEKKLNMVSDLIAYALQMMSPRESFILLRTLLTMLNKKQMLPNEDMAKALGMSDVAYRVTVHRIKRNLNKYREDILNDRNLHLDSLHSQMAQQINDGFLELYPTLLNFYERIIDDLSRADAIKQLRKEYLESTGSILHEPESSYKTAFSIISLCNQFNQLIDS
jgi:hypothetical protein